MVGRFERIVPGLLFVETNGRGDEAYLEPPTAWCSGFIEDAIRELKVHFDQANYTGFMGFLLRISYNHKRNLKQFP